MVIDPRSNRLGRFYEHDDRSLANYPIRTLALDPPVSREWEVGVWLDQGNEGSCVGFGFGHELNAEPQVVSCFFDCAHSIYKDAQRVDEWPGEDYEGTSVLAGAKVVTSRGFYTEYRWAETEDDMARAVAHVGPVVIGVDWYDGMFDPDENGFLNLTGNIAGGHCILVYALNVEEGYYKVWNSWGPNWGDMGTAKIRCSDMARLILAQGEVCLPVRKIDVPVPPAPVPKCDWLCKLVKIIKCLFTGECDY